MECDISPHDMSPKVKSLFTAATLAYYSTVPFDAALSAMFPTNPFLQKRIKQYVIAIVPDPKTLEPSERKRIIAWCGWCNELRDRESIMYMTDLGALGMM
jgi:hypothetical protein